LNLDRGRLLNNRLATFKIPRPARFLTVP